ncbi:MAG: VCBS repeat-containing protein [Chitinophagaceae bacterium]|nr:VCBS repeat-containing protein [Chitinophagaceae bacterium]
MSKTVASCFLIPVLIVLSCNTNKRNGKDSALFDLLPSSETGITFNNKVTDTKELNIFNFRNFYNGAGVAIGDINNDGKPDIFFTANQGPNKLYINKGNWKFEDVTEAAGIKNEGKWYTGVSMADVNGDGLLDIYVCNSGGLVGYNRPNDLYINQGNGTFTEEAHTFGLDDMGLSTHAVFFDYDHDGDLDCFVLNNSPRSIESFGYNKSLRGVRDTLNGDKFYRNDGNKFTDVTTAAGIYGSEIGFGLGVTVGDLNNDGWEDLYVSNDFFERDYLYINQKNGTFKEVINDAMGHISQGSMGSDMVDINNDGLLDIFTTEMLPENDYKLKTNIKFDDYDVQNARLQNDFHHQFTSNCLQLNNGDGTFSEVAQLAGVDATGWSWGALSFDFDNDGMKDLFVCNGISKDLTDQDFLEFFGSEEVLNKVQSGGFNYQDILQRMPSNKISNYAFINQGNLQFKNLTDSLGFDTPSFSNGAAYGDLDNDGDLDLVINNENMEAFVYRNRASEKLKNHFCEIKLQGEKPNTFGYGARVTVFTKAGKQVVEQMPGRGFQSSVDPVLHFGLGQENLIDSLIIRWPDEKMQVIKNVRADSLITLKQQDAVNTIEQVNTPAALFHNVTATVISGNITHHENQFIDFDVERLIPKMLSTEGPALAVGDINGDGLEDFFLSNATGDTAKMFLQQNNGHFIPKPESAFTADKYFETTAAQFFDADGDKDLDLILASGGNQAALGSPYLYVRLYLNDGKGNFIRDTSANWPVLSINASCITLCDIDADGKQDIFIGARCVPGVYGVIPSSALIKNNGNGKFTDVTKTIAPALVNLGMVTGAASGDVDGDGKSELVVGGDWMPITILKYETGSLKKMKEIINSGGWWNCVELNDIDSDGDLDIIAGNTGLNSRIKADPEHPAKMYVGDFDKNGQVECVPVYFKTDGKSYPYFTKGEIQAQIPSLKKEFFHFSDYAGKSIEQVFTADELKGVKVLTVNQTQSSVYLNDGRGYFTCKPLPLMAQLSYLFGALPIDLNNDGHQDLFMAGNFYGLKPQGGRFDASYGTSMLGDGKGNFAYVKPSESGLFVNGEARAVRTIKKAGGGQYILVAMNNSPMYIFEKN